MTIQFVLSGTTQQLTSHEALTVRQQTTKQRTNKQTTTTTTMVVSVHYNMRQQTMTLVERNGLASKQAS